MKGYKIYLTKSCEVAQLIFEANKTRIGAGIVKKASFGAVNEDCRIPKLYHNDGWFYSLIEYEELDRTLYEIVFA